MKKRIISNAWQVDVVRGRIIETINSHGQQSGFTFAHACHEAVDEQQDVLQATLEACQETPNEQKMSIIGIRL